MATTVVYPGLTGAQSDFAIPFEYLSVAHVHVTVGGLPVPFTFSSKYMIHVTTPPVGTLKIARITPNSNTINDYTDGSILAGNDLDNSFYQNLFINQELQDVVSIVRTDLTTAEGVIDAVEVDLAEVHEELGRIHEEIRVITGDGPLLSARIVTTRNAGKALNTGKYPAFHLLETGREGTFIWRTGNFTTLIAADTTEALYLKADGVSSSVGAWVRQGEWAVSGVALGWTGGAPGTDCSTAIEAAAAFGFGVLMFNGDAHVSRQINILKAVNFIRAPSIGVSRIVVNHATADIFNITASGVTFQGIQVVAGVTRTAGAYFKLTNANFCRFEKMYIDGQYQAILLSGSTGVYIQDNVFGGGTPASVAVGGCMVKLTGDVNVDCRFKGNVAIAVPLEAMPSYGIWAQHTDAMQINDSDIIRRGVCLYLNPQSGQSVSATKVSISYFDNAAEGCRFEPAAGGSINRAVFQGCWSASHTGAAWRFTGGGSVGSVSLNGCEGLLSAHGIIQEISADLQVNGGVYSQNANGGFTALNGVNNFSLNGAAFGAQTGLTGNSTGINLIGASHDNYRIIGCDLRGNISATFTNGGPDPAGGSRIFRDNLGYITTNKGEATVPVGQAVVTVNHGLPFTPYSSDILLTATGSLNASGVANFYVTAITSTNFQIACNAVVSGVGLKVGWFIHGR